MTDRDEEIFVLAIEAHIATDAISAALLQTTLQSLLKSADKLAAMPGFTRRPA